MNKSEKIIWNVIQNFGDFKNLWSFVRVFEDNGKEVAQAVEYNGFMYSYPDFECVEKHEMNSLMLIEVKGYDGFFDQKSNCLGIKKKQFKSYKKVQYEECAEVRICFVIWNSKTDYDIYWQNIYEMSKMNYSTVWKIVKEKDYTTGKTVEREYEYYLFDCSDFRMDYKNLPRF